MKIKTLLSLFLFFLFSAATSWAEDSYPEYITDIKLIGGTQDKVDNLKPAYKKLGWTIIDVNLNEGVTGSDFVFLIYKKGSRASTDGGYVTDLYLNAQSGDHPDGYHTGTITYDGRTYYRAPYDGDSDFNTYRGHLNAKAGGMNIHLYYTKANFSDKRALTSITCNDKSYNDGNDKVLYWWNDLSNDPANVNIGNNGRAIYIHVTTATKKNRPSSDPVMATGLVYNGQPQKLIKTAATISSGTMYYKVGSEEYTSTASEVMATEAGDHTVSYYAGANDYSDASDVLSQTVTIAKSPNSSASISITSSLYWDETLPPPVINNLSTGTITYKYSTSQNGTYSTTKPVSSGTYWVKAEIAGDDNCNSYTTAAKSFRFVGWTGSGTSAKPYIISSTEELDLLAIRVNNGNTYNGAYFELGANITYVPVDSDKDGEYESNFTPIGKNGAMFSGSFNGKGHTVSGIVVKSGGNYAGFFGYADGSVSIKNLTIANSTIEGNENVGGIVGDSRSGAVLENCHVSEVSVKGRKYVGGIVGYSFAEIRGCTSDATVSGYESVGGIAGKNYVSVNSLYLGTSVTAANNRYVGTIAGFDDGTLDNCYHTLKGMGGVGNAYSATGEDTDKAKLAAPFTDEPAGIGDAGTPYGTGNYVGITPYTNGLKYKGKFYRIPWTGSGTGTDPYIISSTEELDLLAWKVNGGNDYDGKYFELGADIEYGSKPLTIDLDGDGPNLSNFTPIGQRNTLFKGKFDGKGHKVSGVVVRSSSDYVGLFGYVEGSASIKHLTLVNSSIEGYDGVGGIVGCIGLHVLVENCHVSDVRVKGHDRVGGITGTNWGKIKGCTSAAEVSGSQAVGGIVGQSILDYGFVENSLYYGISVTATNYVGAISGGGGGSFTNNYHTLEGMGGVGNSESATGEDTDGARKVVVLSAADGVTLTLAGNPVNYDVSGITVYEKDGKISSGILFDSKLYAGATEKVVLNLSYTVSDYEVLTGYTDGNGNALAANDDGTYTLTMKSAAATVTPAIKYLWGEGTKGTAENPYIITSTEGLDLLAQKVNNGNKYENTYFELGADITYDSKPLTIDLDGDGPNLSNYTPIGNSSADFWGKFDGKGHTISGIVVKSSDNYVGLFGRVLGDIKNLTLANSSIEGYDGVGGIMGNAAYFNGIIENCHVSGNVRVVGNHEDVGGIVGLNQGKISGSTSAATVSGSSDVGGIAGFNDGSVENSLYYGTSVTAAKNRYVGAISGGADGSFTNNYHTLDGMGGVGNYESATGEDTEGAEFAAPFSVVPAGIGTAETSYGTGDYVGITPYTNGLAYKGRYYYAGTLVEGYAAVQIFEDAEGKKHAIIDGEYDGPDAVNIEEDIDVTSVTFSREFTPNSGFATIMLPFNVNASSLTGVRSIIEFTGITKVNGENAVGMGYVWCNETLGEEEEKKHPDRNCNKYSGELKAYTPYMIEMESATLGIDAGVTLVKWREFDENNKRVGDAPVGNWVFRGTLQKKEWPKGTGIINEGRLWAFAAAERSGAKIGEFVRFGGNNWANPFRAYLVECKKTDNGLDCKDDSEAQPSLVSKYRFADALAPTDTAATDEPLVMRQAAASETASLNSMDIVIVYGDKDSDGDKERPTVIGRYNPATGEIRMLPRTKQTYDLKGRRVGNSKKAKGAYYRR